VSEEDIELLRAGYEAAAAGDVEFVLGLMDPEVEVHDRPEAPDATTYRGHEGVVTALFASVDTFEDFRFVPERFFEAGDRVVVVLEMTGRGRASGVPVEERIAHLWTIRDGRVVELRVFSDPADALEAAGLPRTDE
jgi:ketosteroid isomerase-like protein